MGVPAREENPKVLELQTTLIAIKSQNQTSIPSKPKTQTNKKISQIPSTTNPRIFFFNE
jgi:hypothetical protein